MRVIESVNISQLHDAMQDLGFDLCGFYDEFRWSDSRRLLGFCNALYLNSQYLSEPR
jgi:hypothetical protein